MRVRATGWHAADVDKHSVTTRSSIGAGGIVPKKQVRRALGERTCFFIVEPRRPLEHQDEELKESMAESVFGDLIDPNVHAAIRLANDRIE